MVRFCFYLLLFFSLFINPVSSLAQAFKSGITAGLNTSQLLGGVSSGYRQFGLAGGPFIEFDIGIHKGIKLELLFSQKGERKPIRPNIGDYLLYKLRLNYIEIPVLFLYQYNQFLFEIGPSFNYLAKYSAKDYNGPLTYIRPFNKMELSGNIGIIYPLSENIDMNWRFSNSLIPVRSHFGGGVYWLNRGQYNSVITFKIIYWFNRNPESGNG